MSQEQEPNSQKNSDKQNTSSTPPKSPTENPVEGSQAKNTPSETNIPHQCANCHSNRSKWPTAADIVNSILAFTGIVTLLFTCKALNDNSKQFRVQYEPYLALESIPTSIYPNICAIKVYCYISNLGSRPIHIYRFKFKYYNYYPSRDGIFENFKSIKYDVKNAYIIQHSPLKTSTPVMYNITDAEYNKLDSGKCTFAAEFDYKNDVSEKWRTYIFIVRLSSSKDNFINFIPEVLYNENRDTTFIVDPPKD